jgi:hypothetical protein
MYMTVLAKITPAANCNTEQSSKSNQDRSDSFPSAAIRLRSE